MNCYDRLSGERFDVASEESEDIQAGIEEYLRESLSPGETVAYEVECDNGDFYDGEITGDSE